MFEADSAKLSDAEHRHDCKIIMTGTVYEVVNEIFTVEDFSRLVKKFNVAVNLLWEPETFLFLHQIFLISILLSIFARSCFSVIETGFQSQSYSEYFLFFHYVLSSFSVN